MPDFLLPLSGLVNIVIIVFIILDTKKYNKIMEDYRNVFIQDYENMKKNSKEELNN